MRNQTMKNQTANHQSSYNQASNKQVMETRIKMNLNTLILLFVLYLVLGTAQAQGQTNKVKKNSPAGPALSLGEYLGQVTQNNKSYAGSVASIEGARLRYGEASLLTKPSLLGSTQYLEDRRETGSVLTGDELKVTSHSLGLRMQTEFGLE